MISGTTLDKINVCLQAMFALAASPIDRHFDPEDTAEVQVQKAN